MRALVAEVIPAHPHDQLSLREAKLPGKHYGGCLIALAVGIVMMYSVGAFIQQRQSLRAGASDFRCFYSAGKMVNSGNGSLIYDYQAQSRAQQPFLGTGTHRFTLPFVFVPFVLVIFALLVLLSYPHALLLWYTVNVCLLISVPFLLRRRLGMSDKQLAMALLATGLFLPSSVSLIQGQPTIVVLVLFTMVFLDLDNGHESRAGCWLALTTFKPQFALPLLLALALIRNWKALKGFFSTCVVLFGVSAAIVGLRSTLSFPHALARFTKLPVNLGGERLMSMPNLRGLLLYLASTRLPYDLLQSLSVAVSVLVIGLVLVSTFTPHRQMSDLRFSIVIVVTLLASYHCYGHDLVVLLLPLFLVTAYLTHREFSYFRLGLGMMMGLLLILPSLVLPPPITAVTLLFFLLGLLTEALYPETWSQGNLLKASDGIKAAVKVEL